jgi:hypothetical protein
MGIPRGPRIPIVPASHRRRRLTDVHGMTQSRSVAAGHRSAGPYISRDGSYDDLNQPRVESEVSCHSHRDLVRDDCFVRSIDTIWVPDDADDERETSLGAA